MSMFLLSILLHVSLYILACQPKAVFCGLTVGRTKSCPIQLVGLLQEELEVSFDVVYGSHPVMVDIYLVDFYLKEHRLDFNAIVLYSTTVTVLDR